MSPTRKAVLISLADNANDQGHCWPAINTICERTCLKKTAVIDAVHWLEEFSLLRVDRETGKSNRYWIEPACYTRPADGPVRQTDPSAKRTPTRPANGPHPSGKRTGPVRETDPNRKEPSSNRHLNRQGARKRALPKDFELTPALIAYAEEKGLSEAKARIEFEKFCNYAEANNRQYANWTKAFQNWILKAVEYRRPVESERDWLAEAAI
jgi:hypothetical protein